MPGRRREGVRRRARRQADHSTNLFAARPRRQPIGIAAAPLEHRRRECRLGAAARRLREAAARSLRQGAQHSRATTTRESRVDGRCQRSIASSGRSLRRRGDHRLHAVNHAAKPVGLRRASRFGCGLFGRFRFCLGCSIRGRRIGWRRRLRCSRCARPLRVD